MPVAGDTLVMNDAHEEAAHVNSEANKSSHSTTIVIPQNAA